MTTLWNAGWQFSKTAYSKENLEIQPGQWSQVDLPHDWLIEDTAHLYENSIGWYKKEFTYEPDGLLHLIRFDGVYMDSTVYVNGATVGCWKYGYSTFEFDLTPYLVKGNNELVVRAVFVAPNSRWYSGAGIYRNVWYLKKPACHILSDGVYVTAVPVERESSAPDGSERSDLTGAYMPAPWNDVKPGNYLTPLRTDTCWIVQVDTEIRPGGRAADEIRQTILDRQGSPVAVHTGQIKVLSLKKEEPSLEETPAVLIFHQVLNVSNPLLWEPGKGNLYTLKTELLKDGQVIDESRQRFGFKTIAMDPNQGLFINGKRLKLKGSCEHHGFGCLGAVCNKAAIRRKLTILRQMGVNAIRTAHNMPSKELMDLADEMGFLVESEAFDMWARPKTTYDYGRFFQEWAEKDIASWIRRDRNHASLLMWSVGNEIYDLHAGPEGLKTLQWILRQVKKHDYLHHGQITFASNYMRWENAQKCAELVDAVGYNYGEDLYHTHHAEHPDWVLYGSETASMLASRNVYHFPLETDILCEDNEQCSSLGNCFAGWGAHNYTDNIIADRDAAFSLGQFIWTGFDYFGEPTPYHTKNSYFGQIDTAGFPKDSFYIYQAEWTDYQKNPMVHIFPYWDFNEEQAVDICVCSNAPKLELFLNEESCGCVEIDHAHGKNLVPHWKLPYKQGTLLALAYDLEGNIIARDYRQSFGNAAKLCLSPDKLTLNAKEDDLIFVEISAWDEMDRPVENANNRVQVTVSGAGRLVGLDNGDSTDFDQVKGTSRRLFGGKLLAVIAARGKEDGLIRVNVTSRGLQGAEITLRTEGILQKETFQENHPRPLVAGGVGGNVIPEGADEIPIRKIELSCEGELCLNSEKRTLRVNRRIEPPNATYGDLEWKLVNDSGIESNLASLVIDGESVVVKGEGDGAFQLRCIGRNGGAVAGVRSGFSIACKGLGEQTINPYEKLQAGLCEVRPEGLSEGADHGVRFLGKRDVFICYNNMDFGKFGTNEITLEIFKHVAEGIAFQVWAEEWGWNRAAVKELSTEKGALAKRKLLLNGEFDEAANWLEFKQKTFQLNRKIAGIQTIWISSKDNFQLKSFSFLPLNPAFEKLYAIENDGIFGDAFTEEEQGVMGIGNNVTLVWKELDFGTKGTKKLVLYGRSLLEKNSIHVKFEGDGERVYEVLEFAGSDRFVEREFEIGGFYGKGEVRFVFLPGSCFDFGWVLFG